MKLHEIVKERAEKELYLKAAIDDFAKVKATLEKEISELKRLENLSANDIDLDKVSLAESLMYIRGNPFGRTDDASKFNSPLITDVAIIDIANGCKHLKREFYGNKTYEGYYQRCDCQYGYGPSHGGIKDEIGLKYEARKKELTDEEKDACIYYVKNYQKISSLKVA